MDILDRIKIYNQLMDEKKEKEKEEAKKRLKRDEQGKPIVKLAPLEKTVVHTPTQEDYNILMQICECGGRKCLGSETLPTSLNVWNKWKERTCLRVEIEFNYCNMDFYQSEGYKVISTQEFYNKQKITKEQIKEIKDYFENKK